MSPYHQQQTTNAWLERYAEFDEGPDDTGLIVGPVPGLVREEEALYNVLGEPPF